MIVEPPSRNANLRGVKRAVYVWPRSGQHDPDYARACAETMRRQCEHLYGGHWITVVKRPTPASSDVGVSCTANTRSLWTPEAHGRREKACLA